MSRPNQRTRRPTGRRLAPPKPRRRTRNRRVMPKRAAEARRVSLGLVWPVVRGVAGALALVGTLAGVWFGWQAVVQSRRFQLRHIEMAGNHRVSLDEVLAFGGMSKGDALLGTDLDVVAQNMRRHPWVDEARLRRRLPDGLLIDITEHQPTLVVSLGDLYVANERGEVFKRSSSTDGIDVPVVTGLSRDDFAREGGRGQAIALDAMALAAAWDSRSGHLGRLEELHWDTHLGWSTVSLRGDGRALRVHLGAAPVERLPRAARALDVLDAKGMDASVLWVDGQGNELRVQARLRGASAKAETTLMARAR